jgi:hypothetical protein
MPLPQAKPDKRIYELLKNVDLENLTFADLQAVGQKIFAEQGAEDELRRLVLVNLARLSVAGEWTGLTTAAPTASPTTWGALPVERFTGAAGDLRMFIPAQVFNTNQNSTANWANGMFLYPFMASDNATIDAIQIYAGNTVGTTTKIGVYNSLDNGAPGALQVSAEFSHTTTGILTQTTLTGSLTMTKGETYWMAHITDNGSQQIAGYRNIYASGLVPLPQTQVSTGYAENLLYDATPTSLPATVTLSDFDPVNEDTMNIGLRLA